MEKTRYDNTLVRMNLTKETEKDRELKTSIATLDAKAHRMLAWTTFYIAWSCLGLILIVVKVYEAYNGKNGLLLASVLTVIYIFMGILIYFAWKSQANKKACFAVAGETYLRTRINKLAAERRLVLYYLLEHALLLAVGSIFFLTDLHQGVVFLLSLTSPVTIIAFVAGTYFLVDFTRQIKKLNAVDIAVNHLRIEKHFSKN